MKRFLALLSAPCLLAMGLWAPAALAQERSERLALEQGAASATGQIKGNDSVQYQPSRAAPGVEVGFSPEGSAHRLVLQTIAGAQQSIQMLAYAFQASDIAQALADAQQRGVQVRVVVDRKRNLGKTSRKAMDLLVRHGVALRTNDRFHIHHDKTVIVDGRTVQTGSFNYAPSAETANSENVVVLREMPEVARQYMAHWQSRWDGGVPYPGP